MAHAWGGVPDNRQTFVPERASWARKVFAPQDRARLPLHAERLELSAVLIESGEEDAFVPDARRGDARRERRLPEQRLVGTEFYGRLLSVRHALRVRSTKLRPVRWSRILRAGIQGGNRRQDGGEDHGQDLHVLRLLAETVRVLTEAVALFVEWRRNAEGIRRRIPKGERLFLSHRFDARVAMAAAYEASGEAWGKAGAA